MYKFLCEHMFSFLLGTSLGVEFLGHTVTPCFMEEWPDCLPKHLQHFAFPLEVSEGSSLCLFTRTCYLTFDSHHSTEYEVALLVVVIYISMIVNAEHLFMCLLVICILSLKE